MKKILLSLFLGLSILSLPILVEGQSASTDKFIRIVGVSKMDIKNQGLKVQFSLSEIAGNEYKQIRPKSLDDVKTAFKQQVKLKGIDASKVVEDKLNNIKRSNYGNVESLNYHIIVKNEEEAVELGNIELDGFKIVSSAYVFDFDQEEFLNEMTLDAIKDAKRKANSIANAFGKTVGDVLNIEDTRGANNRNSSYGKGSQSKTKTINYKINITFELI